MKPVLNEGFFLNKVNRFTYMNTVNQSEASEADLNEALKGNNVIELGRTGCGKTTMIGAAIFKGRSRVISVEDTPEISVTPYHLVIPKVNCDS